MANRERGKLLRTHTELAAKTAKTTKGKKPEPDGADTHVMVHDENVPAWVDSLARGVIGAAIQVHRTLGRGFLESVYEAALAVELRARGIEFDQQVVVPIRYRDVLIGEHRLDLLVGGALVVELKATARNHDVYLAQVLSYLQAGAFPLGLILNFEAPLLKEGIRRVLPLL